MTTQVYRIDSVHALDGMRLRVQYQGGQSVTVDCSTLPQRFAVFVPLADADFFRQVAVADWGHGIEWPNGEGLDANRLMKMALEQNYTQSDLSASSAAVFFPSSSASGSPSRSVSALDPAAVHQKRKNPTA